MMMMMMIIIIIIMATTKAKGTAEISLDEAAKSTFMHFCFLVLCFIF
jgi:hypothetical protein